MLSDHTKVAQILLIGLIILEMIPVKATRFYYRWDESSSWSQCSETCGQGIKVKEVYCVSGNETTTLKQDSSKCFGIPKPKMKTLSCVISKCGQKYLWSPSRWSDCSQSCGNLGYRYRNITCFRIKPDFTIVEAHEIFCQNLKRPKDRISCNIRDCPPTFSTDKWSKCIEGPKCQPGNQKRNLKCSRTLRNGKTEKLPITECFRITSPPPNWRKCYDYINVTSCTQMVYEKKVQINISNYIYYQIRHEKKVQLQIGQVGYVFPFSKIVVSCPVENFPQHNVIWIHKNETVTYQGPVNIPVKVNKFGTLVIRQFQSHDEGEWSCMAGEAKESVIIKMREPSSGYKDFVTRNNIWKTGMVSEDSKQRLNRKATVLWYVFDWSVCSVTCGGEGNQHREVQCEKIAPRHYNIIDDNECLKISPKPKKDRICLISNDCPFWKIENRTDHKCSNDCVKVGMSKTTADIKCLFPNKDKSSNFCKKEKPEFLCKNDGCQLEWKVSQWSKCSVSCGGEGLQGRSIFCIWKVSGKSAGSLCSKNNIPYPQSYRKCKTEPCRLGCVDHHKQCTKIKTGCRHGLYRYLCCLTCKGKL